MFPVNAVGSMLLVFGNRLGRAGSPPHSTAERTRSLRSRLVCGPRGASWFSLRADAHEVEDAWLEGHGAGGDVEVFETGELFAGFADGFDGGVVGVGVVDQGFLDSFVIYGPGFEVGGYEGGVLGCD